MEPGGTLPHSQEPMVSILSQMNSVYYNPVSQTSILISFFLQRLVSFSDVFIFSAEILYALQWDQYKTEILSRRKIKKNRAEFIRESPVISLHKQVAEYTDIYPQ